MRTQFAILAILFSLSSLAVAQPPASSPITAVTSAPSGNCSGNQGRLVGPGGAIYTCQNGTWVQIAASGAPPTGPAGGDLGATYPNPTVTNGSHITNSSIPNSGLVNTGTTVGGATCVLGSGCLPGFANSANKGSIIATSPNTSTIGTYRMGVSSSSSATGCSTLFPDAFPKSGVIRNPTVYISSTGATATGNFGPNPNCNTSGGPGNAQSGPVATSLTYLPGSAAGGMLDNATADYWHQQAYWPFAFADQKISNAGAFPGTLSMAAEFVDDAGLNYTLFATGNSTAFAASSNNFTSAYGTAASATEVNMGIPIPTAGTFDSLIDCQSTAPTAGVAATLRKSGVSQTLTATTSTTGSTCVFDTAHTATFAAGDWFTILNATGGTTQTAPIYQALSFRPTVAGHFIIGGYIGGTVSVTKTYNSPLSTITSTTETNTGLTLPTGYTCTNLYVMEAGANAGVITTFTIRDQTAAADTAITGTVSSGAGGITKLVYSGAGVALTAGHVYELSYIAGSGTSEIWGGWAMDCQ